jgi:UDP-glucose 4-epimerase
MKQTRYFCTGGAGFIGSQLVHELSKRGHVTSYDNMSTGRKENNSWLYEGDICDLDRLTRAMAGHDVVFNLAANTNTRAGITNLKLDLFNGLIGAYNVLLAMKANGIKKLVHASTCGVYGDSPNLAVENQPMTPICPYADEKMKAEWVIEDFVKKHNMQAWIFRFGNVIGGGMSNGVIRDLIRKLKADPTKLDVLGSKKPSRPFLCVEDCVSAILFGFDNTNAQYDVFNIAGSGSTDVGTVVKMILKETKLDIPVTYEKQDRGWEGSAIEVSISAEKLKALGWEASMSSDRAVKKAIKEIMEYEGYKCPTTPQ